jgi:hypothetical protein
VIDNYLEELRRRLPRALAGGRFVAEAEAHLRALAEEHGDEEALRRFGSVRLVVARVAPELAARVSARSSRIVLGATLLFVLPFYLIPEHMFPPAARPVPPEIAWEHSGALGAFALAFSAAVSATAFRGRWRVGLLAVAVAGLLTSLLLSAWVDAEWPAYVPGSSSQVMWGVLVALELGLVIAATAAWARIAAASRAVARV